MKNFKFSKKQKAELLLGFNFEASHSLAGYEIPHSHVWNLEVAIRGDIISGKIIDLVLVRADISKILDGLRLTYLNECPVVSDEVRCFPTCETLAQFFYEKMNELLKKKYVMNNPSIEISSVRVGICGMDCIEMGAIRLISEFT